MILYDQRTFSGVTEHSGPLAKSSPRFGFKNGLLVATLALPYITIAA